MLLLPQYTVGESAGYLRGRPNIAHQSIAADVLVDRGRVIGCAFVQQVVPGPGDIPHDANRLLPGASCAITADPGHAIIAAFLFDLFDCRYGVRIGLQGLAHSLAFGKLAPAHLVACDIGHPVADGAAGTFGAVKVQAGLQNAIGNQVVEGRVGTLKDQGGQ